MPIIGSEEDFYFVVVFLIENTHSRYDEWPPKSQDYSGEKFPDKYLDAESIVSTVTDFNHYLRSLRRTVKYFAKAPNDTDINKALGLYYMKAILKRTLRDDSGNLKNSHQITIKNLINKAEYVLSHFIYLNKPYGWNDVLFRLSRLYDSDEPQVYSIGKFNRNRLQKWIRYNGKMNDFHKKIDEASLPKQKYIELVVNLDEHFIDDSDQCLSRIAYNSEPIDVVKLYPCRHEPKCRKIIYTTPSVAYSLSHRLFNIMARRQFRRCFIHSEVEDDKVMDILCSHMYREAVYIARRGYFSRNVFLEHVALCSMFGYEEFHRRQWFKKATSWIDKQGCIYEDHNFLINSTKAYVGYEQEEMQESLQELLDDKCHNHPMALLVIVLAHAVRYTTATIVKPNERIPNELNIK